jgi:hypothetical protein
MLAQVFSKTNWKYLMSSSMPAVTATRCCSVGGLSAILDHVWALNVGLRVGDFCLVILQNKDSDGRFSRDLHFKYTKRDA